jgi:hypothetical protein
VLGSIAGNWLFSGRCWLDPQDAEDGKILDMQYDNLCFQFPSFCQCPKAFFMDSISSIRLSWSWLINVLSEQV